MAKDTDLALLAQLLTVDSSNNVTLAANQFTSSSTNTFTVGTAAYFVANGNLGVGNNAPNAKLQVTGTANVSGNVVIGGALTSANLTTTTNTATIGTAAYFVSNGNLGIGTSSPAYKLDINSITGWGANQTAPIASIVGANAPTNGGGNLRVLSNTSATADAGGSLVLGGYYTAQTNSIDFAEISGRKQTGQTTGGYLALSTRADLGNQTERLRIDSSGNVGIGTTSPNAKLGLTTTAASAAWQIRVNNSGVVNDTGIYADASNHMQFAARNGSGTLTVVLTSSGDSYLNGGNVGIGNTTPNAKLQVTGTANVSGNVVIGGGLTSANVTSSTNTVTIGTTGYFVSNGFVGIGNTAPTSKLHVQGAILASDNITAYSDERLKKNITTIENALEKVNKIRGVRYIQIASGNPGIGLVAQEVQPVIPEVVVQNGEYLSIAYGNMVGLLIEAIKEQQVEIEKLKAAIAKEV